MLNLITLIYCSLHILPETFVKRRKKSMHRTLKKPLKKTLFAAATLPLSLAAAFAHAEER